MTPAQEQAFDAATGVVGASTQLPYTLASIVAVLMLIWSVWVAMGLYRGWSKGIIDFLDLKWGVVRSIIWLSLVIYFVRP